MKRTHGLPDVWPDSGERDWIVPSLTNCILSANERKNALSLAREDLLRDKTPVPAGQVPHLILTNGAPGAGKSTVISDLISRTPGGRTAGDYVVIDFDTAIKYHPRFAGLWRIPNTVTDKPTSVGFTDTYLHCNAVLYETIIKIYEEIISRKRRRYNIVLQSHNQMRLIWSKISGYRTTYVFVGVPLQTAIARSRRRAVNTGKFLATTLSEQDEMVKNMWEDYRTTAAWYGLWADQFIVVDNSAEAYDLGDVKPLVTEISMHESSTDKTPWFDLIKTAQAAIDKACGLKK